MTDDNHFDFDRSAYERPNSGHCAAAAPNGERPAGAARTMMEAAAARRNVRPTITRDVGNAAAPRRPAGFVKMDRDLTVAAAAANRPACRDPLCAAAAGAFR